MLGLLVSALAPTTDRALSIVPIILIPQIMFSNVIFSLSDPASKWISYLMPSRWGMQAMGSIVRISDRFAELDIPFYRSDARHLLGFWGALVGLALVYFALTLIFQKAKDRR
jgi:ABC-type multidrug transport system permease subunit